MLLPISILFSLIFAAFVALPPAGSAVVGNAPGDWAGGSKIRLCVILLLGAPPAASHSLGVGRFCISQFIWGSPPPHTGSAPAPSSETPPFSSPPRLSRTLPACTHQNWSKTTFSFHVYRTSLNHTRRAQPSNKRRNWQHWKYNLSRCTFYGMYNPILLHPIIMLHSKGNWVAGLICADIIQQTTMYSLRNVQAWSVMPF